jgi:hypothetical protein
MAGNTTHLSILTLDVNDLNAPIKRQNSKLHLKKEAQPNVAYKRHSSQGKKTQNVALELMGKKKVFQVN